MTRPHSARLPSARQEADPRSTERSVERLLRGQLWGPVRVTALRRRPYAYATTHALSAVDISLADGRELALLAKRVPGDDDSGPCFRKPRFLVDSRRERLVYERFVDPERWGTPRYFGPLVADDGGLELLLERVRGSELYQVGESGAWRAAAAWLGRLHAAFAERAGELSRTAPLVVQGPELYRRWLTRARRFAFRRAERANRLSALVEPYGRAVGLLAGSSSTFLHGDFYPSNVLVQPVEEEPGWRVRPVDWELAGVGPGVLDLAALVAGDWTAPERADLTEAYRDAWPNPSRPHRAELASALEAARLVVAVQWLGWRRSWSPPPHQLQDWLSVAEDAAGRLSGSTAAVVV